MTATTLTTLLTEGKGILAADEGAATMNGRLQIAGVPPSRENRRAYREMLITTPGLALGLSGVILSEETFRQRLSDGRTFPEALAERGLLPGVKADTGARPLPGAPGETVTEGLDGLRARLATCVRLGARFARWRAVLTLGPRRPSWPALHANAHALARFARLCHEEGVVPIVEPELLVEGAREITRCREVTSAALLVTFAELRDYGVEPDLVVLKPNMVLPGAGPAAPEAVAAETVAALRCAVPDQLGGVAFLAGRQSPAQATANLAAIRRHGGPWPLTFSFGRALTGPALAAWRGRQVPAGQRALANRVACNVAALLGSYTPALEPSYVLA
jgi:fructose-bisphosphate aldolase, class I